MSNDKEQPVDEKPFPFYGYTPGHYMNNCALCSKQMSNVDKLCFVCLECAIKASMKAPALTDEQLDELAKEYALKWIPEKEGDDYLDKKNKKNSRLEIEEHFENGFKAGYSQRVGGINKKMYEILKYLYMNEYCGSHAQEVGDILAEIASLSPSVPAPSPLYSEQEQLLKFREKQITELEGEVKRITKLLEETNKGWHDSFYTTVCTLTESQLKKQWDARWKQFCIDNNINDNQ